MLIVTDNITYTHSIWHQISRDLSGAPQTKAHGAKTCVVAAPTTACGAYLCSYNQTEANAHHVAIIAACVVHSMHTLTRTRPHAFFSLQSPPTCAATQPMSAQRAASVCKVCARTRRPRVHGSLDSTATRVCRVPARKSKPAST